MPASCTEWHEVWGFGPSLCVPGPGQLLQRAYSGLVGSLTVLGDVQASQGLQHATPSC